MALNGRLSQILGFLDKKEFKHSNDPAGRKKRCIYKADVPSDVNLLTYSIFIYSDIVYPTHVGNQSVPILGIIHCNHQNRSQYTHRTLPIWNYDRL